MIQGINTDIRHRGQVFHVQTEPCYGDAPSLCTTVYRGGEVLERIEHPCAELASESVDPKPAQEMLCRQHARTIEEIRCEVLVGVRTAVEQVLADLDDAVTARHAEQTADELDAAVSALPEPRADEPDAAVSALPEPRANEPDAAVSALPEPRADEPDVARRTPLDSVPPPRRRPLLVALVAVVAAVAGATGAWFLKPRILDALHSRTAPSAEVSPVAATPSSDAEARPPARVPPQYPAMPSADAVPFHQTGQASIEPTPVQPHDIGPAQVEPRIAASAEAGTSEPSRPTATIVQDVGPAAVAESLAADLPTAPEAPSPRADAAAPTDASSELAAVAPTNRGAAPSATPVTESSTDTNAGPTGRTTEPSTESIAVPNANPSPEPRGAGPTPPEPAGRMEPEPPPIPQTRPGDLVDLASVDRPPRATERPLPEYSSRARRRKEEGVVELKVLVSHRGVVSDVRVARGIEDSELNAVAEDTARTWRFRPAMKHGVPVDVWLPVRLEFSVEQRETRVRVTQSR